MPATVNLQPDQAQTVATLLTGIADGESATLVAPDGRAEAILTPINGQPAQPTNAPDGVEWLRQWDELTRQVDQAWIGGKTAVEILSEMRR